MVQERKKRRFLEHTRRFNRLRVVSNVLYSPELRWEFNPWIESKNTRIFEDEFFWRWSSIRMIQGSQTLMFKLDRSRDGFFAAFAPRKIGTSRVSTLLRGVKNCVIPEKNWFSHFRRRNNWKFRRLFWMIILTGLVGLGAPKSGTLTGAAFGFRFDRKNDWMTTTCYEKSRRNRTQLAGKILEKKSKTLQFPHLCNHLLSHPFHFF